ncbi:hypothetical protein [Actinomadura fibrosa]|uniref:SGNH/GDSL hydrolase family protein n=1 Tax=Actinomadura fibrosa TaxID=111802 RepID=A0ABW2XXH1_9ACTN|nr:hypothetical protein [Actinomadura fibrosa]
MTTRIACLGDSLTRALISVDHLDTLSRRNPPVICDSPATAST